MKPKKDLQTAINATTPRAIDGVFVRASQIRYARDPLNVGASLKTAFRFSSRGTPCVYVGGNTQTAILESKMINPAMQKQHAFVPRVVAALNVELRNVLRLDVPGSLGQVDETLLEQFGTTHQELTGNWSTQPVSPTQIFGDAVYASGLFAGLYVPSKYNDAVRWNLLIFPAHLQSGDFVTPYDPNGDLGLLPTLQGAP